MTATPNLNISHMGATDTGKYTEANTAVSDFDGAYHGNVLVPYDPSVAFAAMVAEFLSYMVFILTGAPGSAQTISLPANARPFVVINQTGQNITFEVGSNTTTATITDANPHWLYSDGSANVYQCS
jgi:hypothetical protein